MNIQLQEQFLKFIQQRWTALPPTTRPWGMWVCLYPPLPANTAHIDRAEIPWTVWFLDPSGIRTQSIWSWQRFYTVVYEQPWTSGFLPLPEAVLGNPHEIGCAAIAAYETPTAAYVEIVFGGRFGRAWRMTIDETQTIVEYALVWVA